jgi:hypothetical protein
MVPFAPQMKTRFPELPRALRWWPWIVGGLVAGLLGVGYTLADSPEVRARIDDTRIVLACWKEQQKKSLTPEARQFIAVFCEEWEKQFREKHGRSP